MGKAEHPLFFLPPPALTCLLPGWARLREKKNALGHCQGRTEHSIIAWNSLFCWRDAWAEQDRVQCHWEMPAWPWHSHTQQNSPLKPSQKHWRMLLCDQQRGQEFVVQKTKPWGRGWSRSSARAVPRGVGSSVKEKLQFAPIPLKSPRKSLEWRLNGDLIPKCTP